MTRFLISLAVTLGLAPAALAATGELDLGGGDYLVYTDAGFVSVEYTATAFGMTIKPAVFSRTEGADQAGRAIGETDFKRACEAVLATDAARLGNSRPDYVFFQITRHSVDLGLIDLKRSREVFFETRRGSCRPMRRPPEGTK